MARLTPKHCSVTSVTLDGKGGAEVRRSCFAGSALGAEQKYDSKFLRVSEFRFRGMHLSTKRGGAVRIGFVTSPAVAVCRKSGKTLVCELRGDTSSASLRGVGRKKKRKR